MQKVLTNEHQYFRIYVLFTVKKLAQIPQIRKAKTYSEISVFKRKYRMHTEDGIFYRDCIKGKIYLR